MAALDDIAQIRMTVFREWPYLYDGSLAYERQYLQAYTTQDALCVAVYDGDRMVGASTGSRMDDHAADFASALPENYPVEHTFYCAESVLLPEYRGRGLGHMFFDHREDHARTLGLSSSVFASVVRPESHPARPMAYRPLASFWAARGYEPLQGSIAKFSWTDVGENGESVKMLQMWGRAL